MSIPYLNIIRACALRSNQIADALDAEDLEAKFQDTNLTTAIDGAEMPLTAWKLAILASEKYLAEAIGHSSHSLYRSALAGRTDSLSSGDEIGNLDETAPTRIEFIGQFDAVFDDINDQRCTEKPAQAISRINRLYQDGFLNVRPYHYAKVGNRIMHTRTAVYLTGCVWSYTTQAAAYDAQGNSPLPQGCEIWWIAHVLANLPQEGWFVPEAGYYAQIAAKCEADVKGGIVPSATLIDSTSSVEPVKN